MVSRSFPPNLNWIDFNQPGFESHSYATFATGQFVEYVVQIPAAGTYEIQANLMGGSSSGLVQLFVNGESQGEPLDLFKTTSAPVALAAGKFTFLKAGKAIFRFTLKGKNSQSQGFAFDLESITLTPTDGFKLIAPEGACCDEHNLVLQWENLGPGIRYSTFLDDKPLPVTEDTSCEGLGLDIPAEPRPTGKRALRELTGLTRLRMGLNFLHELSGGPAERSLFRPDRNDFTFWLREFQ